MFCVYHSKYDLILLSPLFNMYRRKTLRITGPHGLLSSSLKEIPVTIPSIVAEIDYSICVNLVDLAWARVGLLVRFALHTGSRLSLDVGLMKLSV